MGEEAAAPEDGRRETGEHGPGSADPSPASPGKAEGSDTTVFSIEESSSSLVVSHISGAMSPEQTQLFQDLQIAIGSVQAKLHGDERQSKLSLLASAARSGLATRGASTESAIQIVQSLLAEVNSNRSNLFHGRYFSVRISPDDDGYDDIEFYVREGAPPDGYYEFLRAYDDLRSSLKILLAAPQDKGRWWERWWQKYRDPLTLKSYLSRIALIAATALGRDELRASTILLENVEQEALRALGPRVKNAYAFDLGITALPIAIAFAIVYILIRALLDAPSLNSNVLVRFREFFVLVAGCAVGTWLWYRVRNRKLTKISELVQTESDPFDPLHRITFSIGIAVTIGLLFQSRMVEISINGFSSYFQYNGVRALLIGLFCGISEAGLDLVRHRSDEFLRQAETKEAPAKRSTGPAGQ